MRILTAGFSSVGTMRLGGNGRTFNLFCFFGQGDVDQVFPQLSVLDDLLEKCLFFCALERFKRGKEHRCCCL